MNEYLDIKKIEYLKQLDDVKRANILMLLVFKDKVDQNGDTYIRHLNRVAEFMKDDESKIAALLHDLVEDTQFTLDDLKVLRFSEKIIDTIRLLTNDLKNYDLYMQRLIDSDNILAKRIKIADLLDNMNVNRITNPKKKDYERIQKKYLNSYKLLIEDLERREFNDRY